jgi:hypothetical protein
MNEILILNLGRYAERHELDLAETLGSGKDGIVLVGKCKAQAGKIAVKALRWPEAYERERRVYERLKRAAVSTVLGFNVPQLVGSDDGLRILEMTIVERPFVLDFAGAYLDARPEFPEDVWADWEEEKREQFEDRWRQVQRELVVVSRYSPRQRRC